MTFDIPMGDTTIAFTVCDDDRKWIKEYARVREWLMAANDCGDGRHSEDEIITHLLSHAYMMFTTSNAAAIIEVVTTYDRKDLVVFLAGGDLDEIIAAEPHIAKYGKHLGCSHMQVVGRPGWQRVLKQLDYSYVSSTMIKTL